MMQKFIKPPTHGIHNLSAKLTEDEVKDILTSSETTDFLYEKYKHKVVKRTIQKIRKRQLWKHIKVD